VRKFPLLNSITRLFSNSIGAGKEKEKKAFGNIANSQTKAKALLTEKIDNFKILFMF